MAGNQDTCMLSIVIPYFNEAGSIEPLLQRTRATLGRLLKDQYEIIIVDNGSDVENHARLRAVCSSEQERIVVLSRNFGYQGALWAGLDEAKGSAVVFMDGDGEDPPEVIERFLEKHQEGYQVVYGVRVSRQVSPFLKICYRLFYRLLSRWSDFEIPLDAGEFSLISGQALAALRNFKDRTRMMRILRAWVGFKQVGVPYHREARIAGESKFRLRPAIAFAFEGFVASTDLPVRLSLYCTVFCAGLGVLGTIYYLIWYFVSSERIPGFASLNITILFLFSMLFLCVNVLARYVIKLMAEIRQRPPYLISERY